MSQETRRRLDLRLPRPEQFKRRGQQNQQSMLKSTMPGMQIGSERTRISMCLLLTLGDVASDSKSCNLQVLDELERGVDIQSKRILSEEIIPLMRHMKPSLYLITHSFGRSTGPMDSKLVVTKQNQQTTYRLYLPPQTQ